MTSAEMRRRSETLRKLAQRVSVYSALGAVGLNGADRVAWEQTLVAGADALDCLADIQDTWTSLSPRPDQRVADYEAYAIAQDDTFRLSRGDHPI